MDRGASFPLAHVNFRGEDMPRPRAQTVAKQSGFRNLHEAYWHIDQQYALIGEASAGEATALLRALAVGADAVRELARLSGQRLYPKPLDHD